MKRIALLFALWLASLAPSFAASNPPLNVLAFGAKCDGATNDRSAFNLAATAAAAYTNGGTIVVPSGTCAIATDITLGATVAVQFDAGGRIAVAVGKVVTINGPVHAPPTQIFAGAGTVVFGSGKQSEVFVEWWGASAAASAATNAAAIQAAWTSAFEGMTVRYQNATYNVTTLSHPTTKKLNHVGQGATGGTSTSGTIIVGTGTPILDWPYLAPGSRDSSMTDIEIRGSTTGQTCLRIANHGLNLTRVKASLCLVAIEVQKMYASIWNSVSAFASAAEANSIAFQIVPSGTQQVDSNVINDLQMDAHPTSGTGLKIVQGGAGVSGNQFNASVVANANVGYSISGVWTAGTGRNKFVVPWCDTINTTCVTDSDTAVTGWDNGVYLTGTTTFGAASVVSPPIVQTWTPAVAFGGSSVGITYATQSGRYTKIGNRLFFDARVTLTNKGAQVGAATVSLPVAVKTGTLSPALTVSYSNNMAAGTTTAVTAIGSAASTLVSFYRYAAGAMTALTDADFTNTSDIVISGSYEF